ncbi:MAG: DUF4012 domain-containing protein [Candidatus Buchananbacteria bacterium]|nr:DUF4012 domain-containing protein [Candidatus Buchananbacteria bacterium]
MTEENKQEKTKKSASVRKVRAKKLASTAKKTSVKAKNLPLNSEPIESEVTISSIPTKKSGHVVNLKNPYSEKFEKIISGKAALKTQVPIPPPPPNIRPATKKTKKMGVNFMTNKTSILKIGQNLLPSIPSVAASPQLETKKLPEPGTFEKIEEEIEDIFAPPSEYRVLSLNIPKDWHKRLVAFVIFSLVFVLPLQALTYYQSLQKTQDRVLYATNEAIENLKLGEQAIANFDLTGATNQFNEAKSNFTLAQNEINALNSLTTELIKFLPEKGESMNAGLNLLAAGQLVAETGQIMIADASKLLTSKSLQEYYQSLVSFEKTLRQALKNFREAKTKIESVKLSDLPEQHRQDFEKVVNNLPTIEQGIINLYQLNDAGLKLLGHEQWSRYMLVFLNNNELRATGGFMGSFGLLDIDRGEIKKLDIPGGGTYDIQGQLTKKVISPEPLHLINSRWEFQDSNWWPDFPTAAKKMQWFYQNASNPSVDGVITITSTMMERLLAIFGPIEMPEYGRTISSENFVTETQKIVEIEYDREENRPKQFIADLAPKLLERIFKANNDQVKQLFNLIISGLNEKQLMVYFNDPELEDVITQFGWSGALKSTEGDYLSVVHTNLAGGKTDGVIKETIEHAAEIQPDGSIIDTVKLIRRHTGKPGESVFTGVQNNSYVRFYVPLGSTLLEASGFKKPPEKFFDEVTSELIPDADLLSIETDRFQDEKTGTDVYKSFGKTVFGNWLQLKAGEVQEVTIKYRLPFSLKAEPESKYYYSLLAQKQAGSLGSELKSYLKTNNNLIPLAKFPNDLPSDETGVSFNSILTTDKFYGVVLVNK